MIEVDNLTKYYGPTRSIEGLSFTVNRGEVLGFLGPNGAGKSTTMRSLVGLVRPTSGTARVDGHDVQRDNERVRKVVGYLPEQAPLYGDMTLSSYLEFMAGIKGLGRTAARREMERTTSAMNLVPERRRLLRNLSKGTRQRAAFAQALLGNPAVLILDEPTVGLDPSQINEVRELIRSLAGSHTVVLSTHILPEVALTCSRIVIIADGHIAAQGTPEELTSREKPVYLVRIGGERETFERALADTAPGSVITASGDYWEATIAPPPGTDIQPVLARTLVGAGLDLMELRVLQPTLEEVFLRSIGKRNDS